jgi:hypothetical protein
MLAGKSQLSRLLKAALHRSNWPCIPRGPASIVWGFWPAAGSGWQPNRRLTGCLRWGGLHETTVGTSTPKRLQRAAQPPAAPLHSGWRAAEALAAASAGVALLDVQGPADLAAWQAGHTTAGDSSPESPKRVVRTAA